MDAKLLTFADLQNEGNGRWELWGRGMEKDTVADDMTFLKCSAVTDGYRYRTEPFCIHLIFHWTYTLMQVSEHFGKVPDHRFFVIVPTYALPVRKAWRENGTLHLDQYNSAS